MSKHPSTGQIWNQPRLGLERTKWNHPSLGRMWKQPSLGLEDMWNHVESSEHRLNREPAYPGAARDEEPCGTILAQGRSDLA